MYFIQRMKNLNGTENEKTVEQCLQNAKETAFNLEVFSTIII